MNKIATQSYKTPYGELLLGSFNEQLCLCDWQYRRMRTTIDKRIQTALNATYIEQTSDVINNTISQLNEYFEQKRTQFNISLLMAGTDFQQSVWNALLNIPYGTTSSYLELAASINNKQAVRAVASANGANAMSIIIPCHRVIGSHGELTGYAGGLPAKKRLLTLEIT
ncbi:MAG: cysteine methyltransferase [Piscirickettsiaceae bacterium]|nr:MAG: cysteine methyltransferase [Piscirickettsiaceae bacterium]PCI70289.1 MAG: cysteine methyltransferase [Piscirickettsiaceae bacterium]